MMLQDARKAKGRVRKDMRVVSEAKLVVEKKKKRFEDVTSHYKYNKPMLPPVSCRGDTPLIQQQTNK